MNLRPKIILILILLLALFLRLYGMNWDQGNHLHPDERMIIMTTEKLRLPASLSEFFSPESPLNPHFFAYGSFPLYLLKGSANTLSFIFNDETISGYNGLLSVGRSLSIFFDILTIIVIYKITKVLTKSAYIPLLASFLYTISVLPIQASHFYAVDILLTFLSSLTIYRLVVLVKSPSKANSLLLGIAFALTLATKITLILLMFPVLLVLLLSYLKTKSVTKTLLFALLIFTSSLLIFSLAMPYWLIDRSVFFSQIKEQLRMNSNPYVFPFTLQYVDTTAYWYYLKNIILFGLGIPLGMLAVGATVITSISVLNNLRQGKKLLLEKQMLLVLLVFFWIYFLIVGKSAVKFMRYMLPLYPLFAIFTAYTVYLFYAKFLSKINYKLLFFIFNFSFLILLVWPFSFIKIYSATHTRIETTNWIARNIAPGSTLGVEHWDDRLPLFGGEDYEFFELALYEPDNLGKWNKLSDSLSRTDYLIIASNRLYVPLPKLTDCPKHKNYCYPITAKYYQLLFSGNLGFRLNETFTSYPQIPLVNIPLIDDSADESFTVYDHPKILIFKNETYLPQEKLFNLITNNSTIDR